MNANAGAMVRTVRVSMVVLVALMVGFATVQEAGAKPNNGTNKLSISARVKIATEGCEDLEGSIDVSYSYDEDGKLVSANTSCSGGGFDGSNCTFTLDSTTCYSEPRTVAPATRSIGTLTGANGVAQRPETAGSPGSVGHAGTDVGALGVADAGSTAQSTPAARTGVVLIDVPPSTIQTVEDDQD